MNTEFEFWQLFPLIHRTGCYPTICYNCSYDIPKKEYEITIHSVDGLSFEVFENSFITEINMSFKLILSKMNELSKNEAKDLITELKRGARQCRSFIKEHKVGNSIYEYFLRASFDDGKSNESYDNMLNNPSFLSSAIAKSGLVVELEDIKRNDLLLLQIHSVRFTRVFMNVLDHLEARIKQMETFLQTISLLSNKKQKEYELILINKHTSKELAYLFNLLYRIRFYQLNNGDNEKLYRLIASIYKSGRGPKADKAKTVKNNWNNSEGHEIDKTFLKNFLDNVLKVMIARVQEDIESGYDQKRMSKK